MPDGRVPVQFVEEQLQSPAAPPGESVEDSARTADSADSTSEYYDDPGKYRMLSLLFSA